MLGRLETGTEFSNVHATFQFKEPKITVNGETYPGSEAYYQLMKFKGTPDFQKAKQEMTNSDPMQAWVIGRKYKMRKDFNQEKVYIMKEAITAKFTQN